MKRILLMSALAVLVAGCGQKPEPAAVNDAYIAAQARASADEMGARDNALQAEVNATVKAEANTAMQVPDVAPGERPCRIVPGVNGTDSHVVCP
jgi:hypothetical protein